MLLSVVCACALAAVAEGTHIYGLDKDFNQINEDPDLLESVQPIVQRLKTFKVGVHPRIRFFYGLLRKGMARHVAAVADTLYVPDKYIVHNETEPRQQNSDDEDYESVEPAENDQNKDENKGKNDTNVVENTTKKDENNGTDGKDVATTTTIKNDAATTTRKEHTTITTKKEDAATTPKKDDAATTPKKDDAKKDEEQKKKSLRMGRKMKRKRCKKECKT